MKSLMRVLGALALATSVGACSLGGVLGAGKPPAYMLTLTPEAADPGAIVRSANAGQAVTIAIPQVPKEIRTVRVPVQVTPSAVQYVPNLQYIDTPDRLFAALVAETVRAVAAAHPGRPLRLIEVAPHPVARHSLERTLAAHPDAAVLTTGRRATPERRCLDETAARLRAERDQRLLRRLAGVSG